MYPLRSLILRERLVVTEGISDELFIKFLLLTHGINEIQVMNAGGKSMIERRIESIIKTPGFSSVNSLAIIRDADDDPAQAFEIIRNAICDIGLAAPDRHAQFIAGQPRVGVFIIPDASSRGALEDLCWRAVSSESAVPCVESYMQCLNDARCKVAQPGKARFYAYIASKPEPDSRLGVAAEYGYLNLEHGTYAELVEFLRAL